MDFTVYIFITLPKDENELLNGVITGIIVGMFLFFINLINNKLAKSELDRKTDLDMIRESKFSNRFDLYKIINLKENSMRHTVIKYVKHIYEENGMPAIEKQICKLHLLPINELISIYQYPTNENVIIIDSSDIIFTDNSSIEMIMLVIKELSLFKEHLNSKKYKKHLVNIVDYLSMIIDYPKDESEKCKKQLIYDRDEEDFYKVADSLLYPSKRQIELANQRHILHPLFPIIKKAKTGVNIGNNTWILNVHRLTTVDDSSLKEISNSVNFAQYGPVIITTLEELNNNGIDNWSDLSIIYSNISKVHNIINLSK